MSTFCCDCIYWKKIAPPGVDSFGECNNVSVAMKVALDGKTNLGEDGTLWTEKYFGCVYWRKNDGSLLSTDVAVEDEAQDKADELDL